MKDDHGIIPKWLAGEVNDYDFEYLMSRIAEAMKIV